MAGPKEEEGGEEREQVREPGQKFPTATSLELLFHDHLNPENGMRMSRTTEDVAKCTFHCYVKPCILLRFT